MKKLTSVLTAVLLIAALLVGMGVSAYADDADAEETVSAELVCGGMVEDLLGFFPSAARMYIMDEDYNITMYDYEGNQVSDTYYDINDLGNGYLKIEDENGNCGVMDRDGNVIVPMEYGSVEGYGPFAACYVLTPAEEDDYTTVTFDKDGNFMFWNIDHTDILSLETGEKKFELDADYSSWLFWNGSTDILEAFNMDFTEGRFFDADGNELSEQEYFDIEQEGLQLGSSSGLNVGVYDSDGKVVLEDEYDEILTDYDGEVCPDGCIAARIDSTLYFFDEAGNELVEFEDVNFDNGYSFGGSYVIIYDDDWFVGRVYCADGTAWEATEDCLNTDELGTVDGRLYLTVMDEDGVIYMIDTEGNVILSGMYIELLADDSIAVYDDEGTFAIYTLVSGEEA